MAVQLKGASLMELVISSVIMLIIFMLSMEIITRISTYRGDNSDEMLALQTMKILINSDVQEQIMTYEWGEIEVVKKKLSEKLEEITLIATVKGKKWRLKKIHISKPQHYLNYW